MLTIMIWWSWYVWETQEIAMWVPNLPPKAQHLSSEINGGWSMYQSPVWVWDTSFHWLWNNNIIQDETEQNIF